jgi:transposase
VIDGTTGEVPNAQLFVAALGASSYAWADDTWTQGLGDWIGSHTQAGSRCGTDSGHTSFNIG